MERNELNPTVSTKFKSKGGSTCAVANVIPAELNNWEEPIFRFTGMFYILR